MGLSPVIIEIVRARLGCRAADHRRTSPSEALIQGSFDQHSCACKERDIGLDVMAAVASQSGSGSAAVGMHEVLCICTVSRQDV